MFVGFIAVVVILLVIVGLMATGATSGSGGVDQTKATKAISEISALAQSTGFYKTTVDTANYAGLTTQKLIDAGIVSDTDKLVAVAADLNFEASTVVDGDILVKSKAIPGVYYKVTANAKNASFFDVAIASDKAGANAPVATLKAALDQTYNKLKFNPGVDIDTDAAIDDTNIVSAAVNDGTAIISFN